MDFKIQSVNIPTCSVHKPNNFIDYGPFFEVILDRPINKPVDRFLFWVGILTKLEETFNYKFTDLIYAPGKNNGVVQHNVFFYAKTKDEAVSLVRNVQHCDPTFYEQVYNTVSSIITKGTGRIDEVVPLTSNISGLIRLANPDNLGFELRSRLYIDVINHYYREHKITNSILPPALNDKLMDGTIPDNACYFGLSMVSDRTRRQLFKDLGDQTDATVMLNAIVLALELPYNKLPEQAVKPPIRL